MKKLIYLFVMAMLVSGCASFSAVKYNDSIAYAPTNPAQIKVFTFEPPQKYIKIGEVSAEGAPVSNRNKIVQRLKERAAEMGGDAIILQRSETPSVVSNSAGKIDTEYTPNMVGVVIKFENK